MNLSSMKEKMTLTRGGYLVLMIVLCFTATKFAVNQFSSIVLDDADNSSIIPSDLESNLQENTVSSSQSQSEIPGSGICPTPVTKNKVESSTEENEENDVDIEIDLPKPVPIKDAEFKLEENCFCELQGAINDDCSCQIDAVDKFNNYKIFPRFQSLLRKNYFRFIQVNLKKDCPFWSDDSTCSFEFCQVKPCEENEVPPGLKGKQGPSLKPVQKAKVKKAKSKTECEEQQELGYINTSLSMESKKGFEKWESHDKALVDFCTVRDDDLDGDLQYVDLLLNPERFTGYNGPSAHRVWGSIYNENCFKYTLGFPNPFEISRTEDCIEKRTFYRAISGLHSSINIHLSAKFLLTKSKSGSLFKPKGDGLVWGHNLTEFRQHFENGHDKNESSKWLKNLYFVYLLEMKAIHKISGFLNQFDLYTGDADEDLDLKSAIRDFLRAVESFPYHFEEKALFSRQDAAKLKSDFHNRFTNITKIMDCVGCQKCKLWGKVQTKGLGTALKILFAHSFNDYQGKDFLSRNEIVALFNACGRLSESIYELGNFRRMMESEDGRIGSQRGQESSPFSTAHKDPPLSPFAFGQSQGKNQGKGKSAFGGS